MAVARGGWLTNILERQPLRYMGRISYGLYLYHPLVFYMTDAGATRLGWLGGPFVLSALKVSITLAIAAALRRATAAQFAPQAAQNSQQVRW
jgi:peptidoglycan/LPS O-acetylase OafA/YrhL